MAKYRFPAIFDPDEESTGITITFPDLPGAISQGDDLDDAAYMARDLLEGVLYSMEEDGDEIPDPSHPQSLEVPTGAYLIFVEAWTDIVRDAEQNKTVKKTVTIPKWIEEAAAEAGINFSQTLTFAIKNRLGVSEKETLEKGELGDKVFVSGKAIDAKVFKENIKRKRSGRALRNK